MASISQKLGSGNIVGKVQALGKTNATYIS
jgi:hypothetical protein